MKDLTLVFLRRGDGVLLAMKKRGFGVGKWNGVGGKLEPGETIQQALVRESQEEVGITPKKYHQVAELNFTEHMNGESTELKVHAFVCDDWEGEPTESEEMQPKWFTTADVPYSEMWADDEYWLPQVLDGKLIKGTFVLDEQDKIVEHSVTEVASL